MSDLPVLIAVCSLLGAAIPLAVFDFRYHRLPNPFTYLLIAIAFFGTALTAALGQQWNRFFIALAINLGITALGFVLFYLNGLGLGDVKFLVASNQILGFIAPELVPVSLGLAIFSAAGFGLVRVFFKRATLRQSIAFGPFLILGFAVCALPIFAQRILY